MARQMLATLVVTVTEEDIIDGEMWTPTRCPVVRAINREYPQLKHVWVSDKYIGVTDTDGTRYEWDTPDVVVDFVRSYDEVGSEFNGEQAASGGPKRRGSSNGSSSRKRESNKSPSVEPPSVELSREDAKVRPPRDVTVPQRKKRDADNDNRQRKLDKETPTQRRKREEHRREQKNRMRRGVPSVSV